MINIRFLFMKNSKLCPSTNPLSSCKHFLKNSRRKPAIWKDELGMSQMKQKILLNIVHCNKLGHSITQNQLRDMKLLSSHTIKKAACSCGSEEKKAACVCVSKGKKNDIPTNLSLQREKSDISTKLIKLSFDCEELKKVKEETDCIVVEATEIKNSARVEDVQISDSSDEVAASLSRLPPTSKDAMVRFEDDLMAIKARLCGESSKLQVIPILGMGGSGKTTLAKNAYDDPLTMEYFLARAWVTVSQDYSARDILSSLLVSMKVERSGESYGSIEELVYKSLKGRRYLIVIDDMWSTKVWDCVRMIFPDDHNGSRIVLTTRLSDVATYADSSSPLHEMRFMDADQSWNLLKQKVFAGENCPFELEIIGRKIVRSCKGLPLAIVVVAGLLSTVGRTRASWMNIARNVSLVLNTNDEHFANTVLALSYNHLPHHLRPCFLYMGGFPEDSDIHVARLIKLWVAEGFLKPSGSKNFEEVAQEYLEDLVKRSLVLVLRRDATGKIKRCCIHDLVRDLCIRKACEEKLLLYVKDRNVNSVLLENAKNQRRINITHFGFGSLYGSNIRSVRCFAGWKISSLDFMGKFKLLRVLDMLNIDINSVFSEVFELFHLRYLAFECPAKIPVTISNLQNLQTLIFCLDWGDSQFKARLPLEIWRMPQLRHLVSFSLGPLPDPEGATFPLENLQTLSKVSNFVCEERIWKMIPDIKKLGILYTSRGKHVEDYHLDNLVNLHKLENLKLTIRTGFLFRGKLNPVFPATLKKLVLSGWQRPGKDMTIFGSLPNLEVLKLKHGASYDRVWETREGDFPQLKYLLIDYSNLRQWITESNHFPSLKYLMIYRCNYLTEIPDGIGEIPTLELIEVDEENKPLFESAKRVQEEQQSWGNDALQIRRVPYSPLEYRKWR